MGGAHKEGRTWTVASLWIRRGKNYYFKGSHTGSLRIWEVLEWPFEVNKIFKTPLSGFSELDSTQRK
jgi:hypothetical protein